MRTVEDKISFGLSLANGEGWHIVASGALKSWAEKFASIMELNPDKANGHPRLILIPGNVRGNEQRKMSMFRKPAGFPKKEWETWYAKPVRFWHHRDVADVICEIGCTEKGNQNIMDIVIMWRALHPVYQRVLKTGGLPFHAALIEWQGKGVLLAAPGGTGKSTCCRRIPSPWKALCDDETLIVRDNRGQYFVHPFPTWSKYLWENSEETWPVQQYLPLAAVFFLEQAQTDEIVPIGQGQAAVFTYQSALQVCSRNWKTLVKNEGLASKKDLFNNSSTLAQVIPAYILRVSLQGRFWEKMEMVLRGENRVKEHDAFQSVLPSVQDYDLYRAEHESHA